MAKKQARTTTQRSKRRSFSSFSLDLALKEVAIRKLQPWEIAIKSVEPSDGFKIAIDRLKRFDTRRNERGRELIIDAMLAEAVYPFQQLKIWKGAPLEAADLNGEVDYLITDDKDYLEAPFLCAVEAKKDDFEQGLAQCLVEMKACQLNNQALGRNIDILGIVTNGTGWKFYRLSQDGHVYETLLYSEHELPILLGALQTLCEMCVQALGL